MLCPALFKDQAFAFKWTGRDDATLTWAWVVARLNFKRILTEKPFNLGGQKKRQMIYFSMITDNCYPFTIQYLSVNSSQNKALSQLNVTSKSDYLPHYLARSSRSAIYTKSADIA